MIDTNKQAHVTSTVLEIDLPQLIKEYQKPLATYLEDMYSDIYNLRPFEPTDHFDRDVALDMYGNFAVEDYGWKNNCTISSRYISYNIGTPRNNDSYQDWAKHILFDIWKIMQDRIHKEEKMTVVELITADSCLIYDKKTLIDHLVMELPINDMSFLTNDKNYCWESIFESSFDYFVVKVITAHNAKTICKNKTFQKCIISLINKNANTITLTLNLQQLLEMMGNNITPDKFKTLQEKQSLNTELPF